MPIFRPRKFTFFPFLILFKRIESIDMTQCVISFLVKGFTIYVRGGHLGHVTWTIYINFSSLFRRRLHMKFGFDWPTGFREEDL